MHTPTQAIHRYNFNIINQASSWGKGLKCLAGEGVQHWQIIHQQIDIRTFAVICTSSVPQWLTSRQLPTARPCVFQTLTFFLKVMFGGFLFNRIPKPVGHAQARVYVRFRNAFADSHDHEWAQAESHTGTSKVCLLYKKPIIKLDSLDSTLELPETNSKDPSQRQANKLPWF
jgi:hypothetical protein